MFWTLCHSEPESHVLLDIHVGIKGVGLKHHRNTAACRIFLDRKSTRLNSSHPSISYAVFCLKKKNKIPRFPSHEKSSKPGRDLSLKGSSLLISFCRSSTVISKSCFNIKSFQPSVSNRLNLLF